jgi:catalase (peroxidase I)
MRITDHEVKVQGTIPDSDTVLLEDAVMFLRQKITHLDLQEVRVVEEGYDLAIVYRDQPQLVRLRRLPSKEWHIDLPGEVDAVVSDLPV